MEETNKWKSAAFNGLLLSLITVIISLITSAFEIKSTILSILFWIIRITVSIWLLYYFMKQYSSNFKQISYKDSFIYGTLVCMFSAIICSGFSFINMTLLFPDTINQMGEIMQSSIEQNNMSDEQGDVIMGMLPKLPQITLIVGFIYLTIFGMIASSIIANYTKKDDPFLDDTIQESENSEN